MRLTITAAITARWGHRVDGLIHTHAWTVEATVEGPADAHKIMPADDLEALLKRTVEPWQEHYLTDEDIGDWKGYSAVVWDREPTVEEVVRRLWQEIEPQIPGLIELALVEAHDFDRCRTVRLTLEPA